MQRTFSEKANRIEACKDGEGRWVKASPVLRGGALRAQLEAVRLEGQVNEWSPEQRLLMFPNLTPAAGSHTMGSQSLENVWQPLLAKAGLRYPRNIMPLVTRSLHGS